MLSLADVAPMLLTERRSVPAAPGWLYELKHDGYRVLARLEGGQTALRTRNGADCTTWYPEVSGALQGVPGTHIIDGEVCVLDDLGRPDFERLQDRSRRRGKPAGADPVAYLVFDLLMHRGKDIRRWPVERRKAQLQELLASVPHSVLYVQHIEQGGEDLYRQACMLKLEGIVAKRIGSPYACGVRNADWIKVKRPGAVPPERFKRS